MLYTIELTYKTGDSFNSYQATDRIAMGWNKIAYAQDALERIYEHYAFVQYVTDSFFSDLNEEQFRFLTSKPWFFDGTGDPNYKPHARVTKNNIHHAYDWIYNFWVEDDNGVPVRIHAFWHGYFEDLENARIVVDSNHNEKEFGFFRATELVEEQLKKL